MTPGERVAVTNAREALMEAPSQEATSHAGGLEKAADGTPRYHLYQAQPTLLAPDEAGRRHGKSRASPGRRKSINGCIQFLTKGSCNYGNRCRFSHDRDAPMYSSSGYTRPPSSSAKHSSPRPGFPIPMSVSPTQHPDLTATSTTIMDRGHFLPPLPLPAYADPHLVHPNAGHHPIQIAPYPPSSPISPSKKLLFKDAVLKRNMSRDGAAFHDTTPPSKPPSTQDKRMSRGDVLEKDMLGEMNYKIPVHRNRLHRRDWSMYDRRHKDAFDHCDRQQAPRPSNKSHGADCRCANYRSHRFNQLGVHPASEVYPTVNHEDALYSNLSTQSEALLACLDASLAVIEPIQLEAVQALRATVASRWPDAVVDVYGSNYTRLALPMSDIDCVLVSKSLSSESPFNILKELDELVKTQPWAKRVEFLGSAKIPVLKIAYLSERSNVEVLLDLTCSHSPGHSGLIARDLIYSYQAEMPALRPLVILLKCHLHCYDLNCAFTGGLSSYALVIMAIRFLQACGDEHFKSFDNSMASKIDRLRYRSWSDLALPYTSPANSPSVSGSPTKATWCYTFSRGDCITWRTGIGNLLLLFLETYITFDYRRYGISINKGGEYFRLPSEKVLPDSCSVVPPFIVDPIKPGRNIGNCFRMSEVIQAWFNMYQNLLAGVSLEACVSQRLSLDPE